MRRALVCLALFACSSAPDGGGSNNPSTPPAGSSSPGQSKPGIGTENQPTAMPAENVAPEVLYFALDIDTLVAGKDSGATMTLVATDGNGANDIIGGFVSSPDESTTYFSLSSADATFQATLTWALLQPANISFQGEYVLPLKAKLFDQSGASVEHTFKLTLLADDVCDGKVVDLKTDRNNCGQCGRKCATCDVGWCELVEVVNTTLRTSCESLCASQGLSWSFRCGRVPQDGYTDVTLSTDGTNTTALAHYVNAACSPQNRSTPYAFSTTPNEASADASCTYQFSNFDCCCEHWEAP